MGAKIVNLILMATQTILLFLFTRWFITAGGLQVLVIFVAILSGCVVLWNSLEAWEDLDKWFEQREAKRNELLMKQFEKFYNIKQSKKGI